MTLRPLLHSLSPLNKPSPTLLGFSFVVLAGYGIIVKKCYDYAKKE